MGRGRDVSPIRMVNKDAGWGPFSGKDERQVLRVLDRLDLLVEQIRGGGLDSASRGASCGPEASSATCRRASGGIGRMTGSSPTH